MTNTFFKMLEPPPKDELERVYGELGGSKKRVAAHYGCSLNIIIRWFHGYEIKPLSNRGVNTGKHTVPVAVFGPILQRLMDEHPVMTIGEQGGTGRDEVIGRHRKAEEVGDFKKAELIGSMCTPTVAGRRIMSILKGHQHNVSFTTCDRLTTFFEANHLWWIPPLDEFYFPPWEERRFLPGVATRAFS